MRIAAIAVFLIGLTPAALAAGAGQWTTGATMPSARTEVAVAEVDGKVYVAGGFGGGTALEIYHPEEDRWSRGAPVPRSVHSAGARPPGCPSGRRTRSDPPMAAPDAGREFRGGRR